MCLLDHLTRGRVMLGVGPGALASDAWMMGIDPLTQRRRMEERLEAIVALLRGEGPGDMLRFANAAAGVSCTRLGAINGVPTIEETMHLMQQAVVR